VAQTTVRFGLALREHYSLESRSRILLSHHYIVYSAGGILNRQGATWSYVGVLVGLRTVSEFADKTHRSIINLRFSGFFVVSTILKCPQLAGKAIKRLILGVIRKKLYKFMPFLAIVYFYQFENSPTLI